MDLVEVRFLPDGAFVMVAPGTTLLAASRLAGVDIATGCRRGMCGTDAVLVRQGAEHIDPPQRDERATLERMGLDDRYRLSCSARVRAAAIHVEVGAF